MRHPAAHPGNLTLTGTASGHPSASAPASAETKSLSAESDATTVVNPPVSVSGETLVSHTPPDVPEDPSDPDMLVLGFQELDLSTEALLYSTTTAREEAWCMAVFAGLGEKAVLYEKVSARRYRLLVLSSFSGGYAGRNDPVRHCELIALLLTR